MQSITVAIAPAGVQFIGQQVLTPIVQQHLTNLVPQNVTANPPDFQSPGGTDWYNYSSVAVNLTSGSIDGVSATFTSFTQSATTAGQFTLVLTTGGFNAAYTWTETYDESYCVAPEIGPAHCQPATPGSGSFPFAQPFSSLVLTLVVTLAYANGAYNFTVNSATGTAQAGTFTVPKNSILAGQSNSCFGPSAAKAVQDAVDSLDFNSLLASSIPTLLDSLGLPINLTASITYDFGSGPSGLTFPGNASIAAGGTGAVTWNGTEYTSTVLPNLPVPAAPTTGQHLTLYVASYELDALYWAYFQAGLLRFKVMPSDLSDPAALAVSTYVGSIVALKPYSSYKMQAVVTPLQAPTVSFQNVYAISTAALQALQTDVMAGTLPQAAYTAIFNNLSGNIYLDTTTLESDLSQQGVASQYYSLVQQAVIATGAVVTHDLQLQLNILTTSTPQPNIIFSMQRTDLLTNLKLGTTNSAQTLLFDFTEVTTDATSTSFTFISSTVANFPTNSSGLSAVWSAVDPQYDTLLQAMGQTGVALPILSGFGYELTNGTNNQPFAISVQPQGYVAITANVQALNG
ncbi:hypothetical protein [Hymenobacter negativus]|uniref:Uncharacterized protein n=1 Tax=Hymenobacter negativus TaxID=2795026 RepID=A0ABS3QNW6_9BACT|nr:hypothetical protein [Hymenobacter negativus]MBO2012980.1 hypothetical protein [Hymenobacter negativus]